MNNISRIECVVWAVILSTIASLILINLPPQQPGGFLIIAGIGYLAGLTFLFFAMFRPDR